ncbi:MAG TPA: DUF5615 family PIN-like protein [Acidimicrobiales bacterium]|nr:DUF5615 family PIN-like protein [Acidimicrobiales bacterium]
MKFLVDECLSPGLAVRLTEAGHDSVHALDPGLQGRPDADADFGELLVKKETMVPSLILMRGWTGGAGIQASLIFSNLVGIADDLDAGASSCS